MRSQIGNCRGQLLQHSIYLCYGLTPTDPPEGISTEAASREMILGSNLTLSCDFDGAPIPDVTWIQNNTIELSDSDPRITTTTTTTANAGGSRVATLEITGLDRDGGGLYTCRFSNSVGDDEVNVTTVLILSKLMSALNSSISSPHSLFPVLTLDTHLARSVSTFLPSLSTSLNSYSLFSS